MNLIEFILIYPLKYVLFLIFIEWLLTVDTFMTDQSRANTKSNSFKLSLNYCFLSM